MGVKKLDFNLINMFYKKENSGDWHQAEEVLLPIAFDSEILNSDNRKSIDGWEWHETPPTEYLDWKDQQNIPPFPPLDPQL